MFLPHILDHSRHSSSTFHFQSHPFPVVASFSIFTPSSSLYQPLCVVFSSSSLINPNTIIIYVSIFFLSPLSYPNILQHLHPIFLSLLPQALSPSPCVVFSPPSHTSHSALIYASSPSLPLPLTSSLPPSPLPSQSPLFVASSSRTRKLYLPLRIPSVLTY